MLNQLYVLPDKVKVYVRPKIFVPQADVKFIQPQVKKILGKNGLVSPTGVTFKIDGDPYYYRTADNFLFLTWNPLKKVSDFLSKERRYSQRRGYGERNNFLHPDGFKNCNLSDACPLVYQNIEDSIQELRNIYQRFVTEAFGIEIKRNEITSRLFEIEVTLDSLSKKAPDEILPLHYGFECNHYVCSPFPDQQLRGIYAQVQKRDGTYGSKTARMYLKAKDIIRYEHIFARKVHGDLLPKADLCRLSAIEIENLLEPLRVKVADGWQAVVENSVFTWTKNAKELKIRALKRILVIFGRKVSEIQLTHLENLVENGYLTTEVVQDYRFMRRLRETGCIIPGKQEEGKKKPKFYKFNTDFLLAEDDT